MNPGADVRSLDALQSWYATLAAYGVEARDALAAVQLEIHRASEWIQHQIGEWKAQVRRAEQDVFRAKMELRSRQQPDFSGRIPDTSVEEKALRRAEAKLEFARRQVTICQRWLTQITAEVGEVYDGPARRLGAFLEGDLPRALAVLDRQLVALERYSEIRPPDQPEGLRETRPESPPEKPSS